ncbi:WD repeat-containing protein 92 [Araneus ventricosus]|uniref:WD repeat-containing protein 92 n=1 Tax=Araneus ventricosus TaxID=182803 RepID=A0A4Y2HR50_ARAVE|nr:WD repeat-containing protein 92 [Araneus ventricosus]
MHQRHLATGDFEGNLQLWDIESLDSPLFNVRGHTQIINAIDAVGGLGVGAGAPEIVTGSKDGAVKVWDCRQKDLPVATMEPEAGQDKRDCWAVAFVFWRESDPLLLSHIKSIERESISNHPRFDLGILMRFRSPVR